MATRTYKPVNYNRKLTITYNVLLSKEYRSLSAFARDVYVIFLYKRQFSNKKRPGKSRTLKNNCALQFTENEAAYKWGIPKRTFRRAIQRLIQAKILRVAHKGFGTCNDPNLYELLGKFDGIAKDRDYGQMQLAQGQEHTPGAKETASLKDKYAKYLESEDWAEKRQKALAYDGYKCFQCGAKDSLQVHHMSYRNWYDVNPKRDLVTLCRGCHEAVSTRKLVLKKKTVNRIRKAGEKPGKKFKRKRTKKQNRYENARRELLSDFVGWAFKHARITNGQDMIPLDDLLAYLTTKTGGKP